MTASIKYNQQQGFSIAEILIAVAISATLVAGILQIFVSNKQTYNTANSLSELQESARFAMMFINKAVRSADNWGCVHDRDLITGANYPDGISGVNDLDATEATSKSAAQGTDTITLTGAYGVPEPVVLASGKDVLVADSSDFKTDMDVLISNCQYGQIVTVNKVVSATQLELTTKLDRDYTTDATIQPVQSIRYQISYLDTSSGQLCATQQWSSSCVPNLMLDEGDGVLYSLINGVEDMQIQYGEDTDGDQVANYYVDADNITDMNRVVSIKIELLMATIDEVASDNLSYTFNGTTQTATDKRIRKVFSTTIALRNRLL